MIRELRENAGQAIAELFQALGIDLLYFLTVIFLICVLPRQEAKAMA